MKINIKDASLNIKTVIATVGIDTDIFWNKDSYRFGVYTDTGAENNGTDIFGNPRDFRLFADQDGYNMSLTGEFYSWEPVGDPLPLYMSDEEFLNLPVVDIHHGKSGGVNLYVDIPKKYLSPHN